MSCIGIYKWNPTMPVGNLVVASFLFLISRVTIKRHVVPIVEDLVLGSRREGSCDGATGEMPL